MQIKAAIINNNLTQFFSTLETIAYSNKNYLPVLAQSMLQ